MAHETVAPGAAWRAAGGAWGRGSGAGHGAFSAAH